MPPSCKLLCKFSEKANFVVGLLVYKCYQKTAKKVIKLNSKFTDFFVRKLYYHSTTLCRSHGFRMNIFSCGLIVYLKSNKVEDGGELNYINLSIA